MGIYPILFVLLFDVVGFWFMLRIRIYFWKWVPCILGKILTYVIVDGTDYEIV